MLCKLTSNIKLLTTKKNQRFKAQRSRLCISLTAESRSSGDKFPLTDFKWIGPYVIEKVLPNNKYLVHQIGNNKTQVLHPMRMCQLTPHQPPPDIRITPQEWKPDPEVSLKHDDLYARPRECEYEKPIFDAEKNNATPPTPPEVPVQCDLSNAETRNKPATPQCPQEIFPQTEQLYDVTDTCPNMEPDMETSSENQAIVRPTPAVPNKIYVIIRSLIAMTITDTNS